MPDLRINAAANGLAIVNGQINTANVSKEQAESLIAQISASLIKRDGTARSGYLKVHAEQDGALRFSTGHFSKGAKASAAKLMHELAIKAWGESSVDTKALENYLRAPDRREGQNIALNARKAGTISLLKLVSNRYDAYNSNDQAHTLTTEGRMVTNSNARLLFAGRKDNAVSQLQTYADRYLRESREAG